MRARLKLGGWVAVVGMVLAIRSGLSVWRLYRAGERVKAARVELGVAGARNEELKKRLVEVQSPGWLEREAREKLGLGKPGEVVVIEGVDKLQRGMKVAARMAGASNVKGN